MSEDCQKCGTAMHELDEERLCPGCSNLEPEQASCNNEREDLGVSLNTPCKACGRGPCIDR